MFYTYIKMDAEEAAKKEREVKHKLLVPRVAFCEYLLQVHWQRDSLWDYGECFREHVHQPLIVVVWTSNLETANFCEALESHIAKFGNFKEPCQKGADDGCFKYVP